MASRTPSAARLVGDLVAAVERKNPVAALLAAQALAERLGPPAAHTLSRMLLAGHRQDAAGRATIRPDKLAHTKCA